jgi:thiosulfate/3-mercaptopyruvate sulfurtransferase
LTSADDGPLVSADRLDALAGSDDCVVVDCRFRLTDPAAGREAYLLGHIPGARYADLDKDLSRPPSPHEGRHPLPAPEAFAERLGRWGITSDSLVVAYDDASGAIAARLWWMLRWVGHRRAAILDGGLDAWVESGLPIQAELPEVVPSVYELGALNDDWVVTTAELMRREAGELLLADARAPARFRGEHEPIDPVAGHIPGAVNWPFNRNLDERGRLVAREQILENLAALGTSAPSSPVVAMCGSGVTACHLLWALQCAGYPSGRLYVGSWSEWIRDPDRQIATGRV